MIDKLKKEIINNIKINARGYILIIGVFVAGLILSVIVNISSGSEEEIRLYVNDFIENVKNYSTDSGETFNIAFTGYVKLIAFLLLMSLTMFGFVGIYIYVFIKGFSYGSVFVALMGMSTYKGYLFFLAAILPHILVSAPCCIYYLLHCIKKSHQITKGMRNTASTTISSLLYGCLCMVFLSVGALVQSYLEPLLIRIINFN